MNDRLVGRERGAAAGAPRFERSSLLSRAGFRHAFFERGGGVSAGPYASLNFSSVVGDAPDKVGENHERAGNVLGVPAARLLYLSQVHGSAVHFSRELVTRDFVITLEGDAIGGTARETAYGVRTADCVPILLADTVSGAVMAVHAGWRGVVANIVAAAVRRLREERGARGPLLAAIGPHISAAAFEVSEDVAGTLARACPERPVVTWPGSKPHVNLRSIVRAQLERSGIGPDAIDDVGGCTFASPERYFSFRRDGKASGRHLSAIVPQR